MTVDHSDHEVVGGAHRCVQQLVFTATQLVEVIARMRAQTQARQADADRAAAATDTAAADQAGRDRAEQRAAITQDREHWAPVSDPGWRRAAEPEQLLTAWAAATTWAGHDPAAAAAMTRTEAEIRHRWPELGDRYDRLRVADGLHPAAAMSLAIREAAAAGWDPTKTADNPAAAAAATDTAREWHGRAGQEQQAADQAATHRTTRRHRGPTSTAKACSRPQTTTAPLPPRRRRPAPPPSWPSGGTHPSDRLRRLLIARLSPTRQRYPPHRLGGAGDNWSPRPAASGSDGLPCPQTQRDLDCRWRCTCGRA